jgi:hypothetical protein
MTSRDGKSFKRWAEAWIRPGPQSERWVCRNNFVAWGMLETQSDLDGAPNELSFYSMEGYYQGETCQVRRYTIRIDGFVSVWAPSSGGELVTRPLTFAGSRLRLNFSTSAAGSIRVGLQQPDGGPVSGFSLADCQEVFGDELQRTITWSCGSDLTGVSGQPVRLHFALRDADLFSLEFVE